MVSTNIVKEVSSEMELMAENLKGDQTAIVAALSFRVNVVLRYERCGGLAVAVDLAEILMSFGYDSLAKERDRELFRQGARETSTTLLMSQAGHDTLIETVPIGRDMNHHENLTGICELEERRRVGFRVVTGGRGIAEEKIVVFDQGVMRLCLLNNGENGIR